jgi:hypothetical protein
MREFRRETSLERGRGQEPRSTPRNAQINRRNEKTRERANPNPAYINM